jgi:hypothetical protein
VYKLAPSALKTSLLHSNTYQTCDFEQIAVCIVQYPSTTILYQGRVNPLSTSLLEQPCDHISMASASEQEHDTANSDAHIESDLPVQPIDVGLAAVVDGLITGTAESSSESDASSVEAATSFPTSSVTFDHGIEKPTLKSPFRSPKSPTGDCMCDTTLDGGDIRVDLLNEATEDHTHQNSEVIVGVIEDGHQGDQEGNDLGSSGLCNIMNCSLTVACRRGR